MLNEMIEETKTNLDVEESRCTNEDRRMTTAMDVMRGAVANFNAGAAGARGRVVGAQGSIGTTEVQQQSTEEAFDEHKKTCVSDIVALKRELQIVTADAGVMSTVLTLIGPCPTEATQLVQCDHCDVMSQHPDIHKLLTSLKSQVAQTYIADNLKQTFDDSVIDQKPLSEEGVGQMLTMLQGHALMRTIKRHVSSTDNDPVTPPPMVFSNETNVSEVPEPPAVVDCVPTTKCTVGAANCRKLKDRFLVVQAGILDQKDSLEQKLGEKEDFCQAQTDEFGTQLGKMAADLAEERTKLATATEEQNKAESGSHTQSQAHDTMSHEYARSMKECCDNQNAMRSEICALDKIRGELNNMEGNKVFITDCEVSDWQEEACTAECAGGTITATRKIITHVVGTGVACPPLTKVDKCNEHECPVHCEMDDWSAWSECSAQCGGGVMERKRDIVTQPKHFGSPCGDTEDEDACGFGSCNVPCILADWTEWSGCSKACGGGSSRRIRAVKVEKQGTGECFGPEDEKRMEFDDCNQNSCEDLLADINGKWGERTQLHCASEVDVTIMVDGSGSLSPNGWETSKQLCFSLVGNLLANGSAQVAVQVFSGPDEEDDFIACTRNASGGVDIENQCKIKWISHLTNNMGSLYGGIMGMQWPKGSTLTSVALGLAEAEQKNSRETAQSVVVVLTDGQPMSPHMTEQASKQLGKVAKIIWVPIGENAPREMIKEWASKPESDHVISVDNFMAIKQKQAYDDLMNKIVTTTCPQVN